MDSKQKTALQKEIIDCLPANPHGRALLAPRTGKTKLIIDLIKRDKPKSVLWVTPSKRLAEETIPKEFLTWKARKYLEKVITVTYHTLSSVIGNYDWIVFDEDQFITEANIAPLFNGNIKYNNIIGMTGTPSTDWDKQTIYNNLKLKPLYKLLIGKAVDIGLLADYQITVVEIPMNRKKKNVLGGSKANPFMQTEYANIQYMDKVCQKAKESGNNKTIQFRALQRRRAIQNSPNKRRALKILHNQLVGRKISFAPTIAIADELAEYVYHSKSKNEDLLKFITGDIDSLMMVNTGGVGFTFKALKYLLVSQTDSDTNGTTSQKITRILLSQDGDYKAQIYVLCLMGTQDEIWVKKSLKRFDPTKINKIKIQDLCKEL